MGLPWAARATEWSVARGAQTPSNSTRSQKAAHDG